MCLKNAKVFAYLALLSAITVQGQHIRSALVAARWQRVTIETGILYFLKCYKV